MPDKINSQLSLLLTRPTISNIRPIRKQRPDTEQQHNQSNPSVNIEIIPSEKSVNTKYSIGRIMDAINSIIPVITIPLFI
jgi:hypothetical protein